MAKNQRPPKPTPFQRRVVLEYLVDFNARAAYVRAGGAAKGAYTHGPALLRKPHIRAHLAEQSKALEDQLHDKHLAVQYATYDRALVDPLDALDANGEPLQLHKMPLAVRRAVKKLHFVYQDKQAMRDDGKQIVERVPLLVSLELHDSRPDREMALKLAGKLRDKVELTGEDGAPISVTFNLAPPRQSE